MTQDGHAKKHFPNSLAETFRLVSQITGKAGASSPRNMAEFLPLIEPYVSETIEKYKGSYKKSPIDLEQHIQKLEGNKIRVHYAHLRAYAEYLGIPASSLLIFAHLLGDVAKGNTLSDIEDLIEKSKAGLTALFAYLEAGHGNNDSLENKMLSRNPNAPLGEVNYRAKREPLERMVRAIVDYKRNENDE